MANPKGYKLTRSGHVKMHNKKVKADIEVMPESVPVWLDKGWTVSDAGSKAVAAGAADVKAASADEKN